MVRHAIPKDIQVLYYFWAPMKPESTRQKKFSKRIQQELGEIFQYEVAPGPNVILSVNVVRTSPDLLSCRVYISVFPTDKREEVMEIVAEQEKAIRGALGQRIGKQVRRIPELTFYLDDTLDEVEKMDQLFDELRDDKE